MKKLKPLRLILTSTLLTLSMSTLANAAGTIGTVTATSLNVRQEPSTASTVVDKAYYGEKVSILSKEGNWYKIKLSENQSAYVSSTFVNQSSPITPVVAEKAVIETTAKKSMARVVVPVLNFRSSPFITESNVIDQLKENDNLTILSVEGDWTFVSTVSEQLGYVFGTYIKKIETPLATAVETPIQTYVASSDVRNQVVDYAKQFLGNPYVFGGTSLTGGVDCSSFTQQMMKNIGYKISRTSYTQIHDGTRISLDQLLPGDLVFYGFDNIISHVAMYIGSGKIIHASSPTTGIIISGLYTQGKKPVIGATRIIQ